MAADAKALLDSLMGTSRDKPKDQKRDDDWKEDNVCKYFLVGFCPAAENDNWFHNAKLGNVQVCKKVHSERLKQDFDKHPEHSKFERKYEVQFLTYLEGLIAGADARVSREKANITNSSKEKKVVKVPTELQNNYDKMLAELRHQTSDAAMLDRHGQSNASKALAERADKLKEEIKALEEQYTFTSAGDTVCEVCGVRCSLDSEKLYEGHVNSNLHSAYARIREKAKDLKEKIKNLPPEQEDKEKIEKKKKKSKSRSRRRSREKSKSRERSRRRSRERDRRSRDRDRKGRDRGSDRGRGSRERDRDRDRRRDRSR